MSIELQRRALTGAATDLSSYPEDVRKRSLELSAYFTVPAMEPSHRTLAWFSAMNLAYRNKQLSSTLSFANQLIDRGTNPKFKESVSPPPAHAESRAVQVANEPRRLAR